MGLFGDLIDALFGDNKVDETLGTTPETATPLKRVLPLICDYDNLDEDIKYNLSQRNSMRRAINYRTIDFGNGIEYPIAIYTTQDIENKCSCDYTLFSPAGDKFWIFYNIYDFIDVEFLLRQIRVKEGGVYHYKLNKEVKDKLPTLCKLLSNATQNDTNPKYGLPFITFIDREQKYPLLGAWFAESSLQKEGDMDNLHRALWQILNQLVKEMQQAGLLNQSIKAMARTLMRIGLMINRLN